MKILFTISNEMSVRQILRMNIIVRFKNSCDLDITPVQFLMITQQKSSVVLVGRMNISIVGMI